MSPRCRKAPRRHFPGDAMITKLIKTAGCMNARELAERLELSETLLSKWRKNGIPSTVEPFVRIIIESGMNGKPPMKGRAGGRPKKGAVPIEKMLDSLEKMLGG